MKFESIYVVVSEEKIFENIDGRTDGQTYLQDGCSEFPNGNLPIHIYEINPRDLTPQEVGLPGLKQYL